MDDGERRERDEEAVVVAEDGATVQTVPAAEVIDDLEGDVARDHGGRRPQPHARRGDEQGAAEDHRHKAPGRQDGWLAARSKSYERGDDSTAVRDGERQEQRTSIAHGPR